LRNLEDIERDLAEARVALSQVEGTTAEVYSRIVGYYRSVRNWNRGKREEYGERRLFDLSAGIKALPVSPVRPEGATGDAQGEARDLQGAEKSRLLLFVRPGCPVCPSAKEAARRLGIPVDFINADTEEGIAEAQRRQVQSTPTAILLANDGKELSRAWDPRSIASFSKLVSPEEAGDFKQAAS
jgi:ribonucleoside-triphosphate reductase